MTLAGSIVTAAGWLLGAIVFLLNVPRIRLQRDQALVLLACAFIGGTLGAKFGQGMAQGAIVQGFLRPELGGRAIFTGILGGWIAIEIGKKSLKIKHSTGDAWAMALPAGEAVGRIGCFLNGCCYGRQCALPWSVFQHDAWRHPSQIYSAIASIGILGIIWHFRNRLWPGRLFLVYLGLFGVARFLIESTREPQNMIGPLSAMQWLSIELVVSSSATLAFLAWKGRFWRQPEPAEE